MDGLPTDQRFTITAGCGEYEGHLFAIKAARQTKLHVVWLMRPDGSTTYFPLSKAHFLEERNAVRLPEHTKMLWQFVDFLTREGATGIPVWAVVEGQLPSMITLFKTESTPEMGKIPSREQLGEWIREGWIEWAQTLPNPKYDWIKPYAELSPSMKEADNVMGEYMLKKFIAMGLIREDEES